MGRMDWSRLVGLCALTALLLSAAPSHAITTAVDPGDIFVAEEVVPPGHILMFSFQLHPDYLLTVSAKDRDTGLLLQWWRDEESGTMTVHSSDTRQVYHFLFDNSNSVLTYKNVNFDIRVVPDPEFHVEVEQLDPIERKIHSVARKMLQMKGLQQTLRHQQRDHRATVEDANERVLLWSVLQVVGFVVACGGQLVMLKLLLERKRTV
jgi:p24 family protein beta-1